MIIHGLFDEQEMNPPQGLHGFSPYISTTEMGICHQSLKTVSPSGADLHLLHHRGNHFHDESSLGFGNQDESVHLSDSTPNAGSQHHSLQIYSANRWNLEVLSELADSRKGIGEDHQAISGLKTRNMKSRKKLRDPRFCFKTLSDIDVLDDGYKWRKYGQKVVKNTQHPRSYYRCTHENCRVKKRVERLAEDPRMVITTYEGRHAHSPDSSLNPSSSYLF